MNLSSSDNKACRYIVDLIYERCRVKLHDGKEALIRARLGKLMRRHGIGSLAEYVDYLQNGAGEEEFTRVVDALTTNFTSFLREPDHFDFLVQTALPQVLARGQKRFRVWSAACSSGEEPYSLALYLAEHFPLGHGWDWHICASDISTRVLDVARQGVYPQERVAGIPRAWLMRYFLRGVGDWEGQVRVKPVLSQRVSFRQVNLNEPYEHSEPFEVVFCRNVMIYFDRPTQEHLVQRLCGHLVPGGYLLIGHSESLNGLGTPLRCLRPSIYQRN